MVVLFLIALFDALYSYHENKRKLLLLVLAFIYSVMFENLNIYFGAGGVGSYVYSEQFNLFIINTPLFISLAWACLIYTAMHISDLAHVKTLYKPFMDALVVVLIDLTLDVVAVRQGLWTWLGMDHNTGWFGIPADNFIGWMLVVITFSFLFRYFTRTRNDMINKTTRTEYFFLLPAFAYLGMMIIFSIVNLAERALEFSQYQQLFTFWVIVIICASLLRRPKDLSHPPILKTTNFTIFTILFTRLLFFAYIIWSVVLMELHKESRLIIVILLLSLVIEILVYSEVFSEDKPKYLKEHPHY